MTIYINGTTGISGVDGSAGTPAVQGTDTNTGVFYPAADTVCVSTGGSERVRVDSSGNVGIGTSSPGAKLGVGGGAGNAKIKLSNTASGSGSGDGFDLDFTGTDIYITNRENGFMAFENNGAERCRIDSSGNLLVGTTTSGGKLTVTGGGQTSYFTQSASGGYVNSMSAANNSGAYYYINFLEGATSRGAVTSNGSVMTYGGTSDYRLKENVSPMTGALERIIKLNPVTYTWKDNGRSAEGFIAHELQAIVPDAVSGEKDAMDSEGNPLYQNVDPRMVVPVLVKAIQEQQALITALTARIEALEAK